MDHQVEAMKRSAPLFSFARGKLGTLAGPCPDAVPPAQPPCSRMPPCVHAPGERMKLSASDFPGPGSYPAQSAIGQQPLSANASPPRIKFGSLTRDQASKMFLSSKHIRSQLGQGGQDPGHYKLPPAVGKQYSSNKKNLPSYTFGRTDRLK